MPGKPVRTDSCFLSPTLSQCTFLVFEDLCRTIQHIDILKSMLITLFPNTFSHVNNEKDKHSYGEHHHTEDGLSLIEID